MNIELTDNGPRKKVKTALTTAHVELAVAHHLNWRRQLIVPNVSWGWGLPYEADMVVVKPSGYGHEIEIKVSAADIRADLKKRRQHDSPKFKALWFAVPEQLAANPNIPERAGIYAVADMWSVRVVRPPKMNRLARPLERHEINRLCELAAMRVWQFKEQAVLRLEKLKDRNNKGTKS